jgi:hypothetical protein
MHDINPWADDKFIDTELEIDNKIQHLKEECEEMKGHNPSTPMWWMAVIFAVPAFVTGSLEIFIMSGIFIFIGIILNGKHQSQLENIQKALDSEYSNRQMNKQIWEEDRKYYR